MQRKPFFNILISAGGVVILSQAVAMVRQIVIVSSYGFSRDLDFYTTLFAIMAVSVLSLSSILESNFIGLLSELKAEKGEDAVRGSFLRYFGAAILFSVLVIALLIAVFPVLSLPFTAGFSADERARLTGLGVYFLPWALLILPFAALGACLKSIWCYREVFLAELVVAVVSTVSIYYRHGSVGDIALAYALGYAVAILLLLWTVMRQLRSGAGLGFPWRRFSSRFVRHFGSNQIGILQTMAERFWFSHLPAGNIAALGVVQQLTMSLTGLVSFRDAYVVPLADESGRGPKLTRLLVGMFLLAAAGATFVAIAAQPISELLYQYGKASSGDVALIALLLQIGMISVITVAVATPVWRVQQVGANYRPMVAVYLISAVLIFALGAVFIGWLHMDAAGMAIVSGINAMVACTVAMYFAERLGASPTRMQWSLLARSILAFAIAGSLAFYAIGAIEGPAILRVAIGGIAYGLVLAAHGLLHYRQLRTLVSGSPDGT